MFNIWGTNSLFVLLWIFPSWYIYHSEIANRYIPSQLRNLSINITFLWFTVQNQSANLCKNSILHFPRKVDQNFTEFCRIITFSRMRFKINYYANSPFYKLSRQVSRAFKTVLHYIVCLHYIVYITFVCITLYHMLNFMWKRRIYHKIIEIFTCKIIFYSFLLISWVFTETVFIG